MRKFLIVLYVLIIIAVLGLIGYEVIAEQNYTFNFLSKAVLCLLALIGGIVKQLGRTKDGKQRPVSSKAHYKALYGKYIGNAFSFDKKLEKQFYKAVDYYANDKPEKAVKILEKLREQREMRDDNYAATVFLALSYDDMGALDKAIQLYNSALYMKEDSSLANNLGYCYQRKGDWEQAMDNYHRAISIDDQNAYPYNNIAQIYLREGDWESALDYAEQAVEINSRMPQALNAMAISHYMLGDKEEYERYYRQAVSCGSDGKKLKAYIASLDPYI